VQVLKIETKYGLIFKEGKHWSEKKPVKIQDDSNSFDIAESKYETQIAPSPTRVKEKGWNSKTTFVIKSTILFFNYNAKCQVMNNEYGYGILSTKLVFIKHSLRLIFVS
jgi:hypothetical protein